MLVLFQCDCHLLHPSTEESHVFCLHVQFLADVCTYFQGVSWWLCILYVLFWKLLVWNSKSIGCLSKSAFVRQLVLLHRQESAWWSLFQSIRKFPDTSIHTYSNSYQIKKFPLWRPFSKISGYGRKIRWIRVDASRIRKKNFAFSQISGYVWTGPKKKNSACKESAKTKELALQFTGKYLPCSSGPKKILHGVNLSSLKHVLTRLFMDFMPWRHTLRNTRLWLAL